MRTTPKRYRAACLLAALPLLVAGCGGSSADPKSVLQQAKLPSSGTMAATVDVSSNQSGKTSSGQLKLEGPFESNGAGKLPSFKFTAAGSGAAAAAASATVVSTGGNSFLTVGGTSYELGTARTAQLNQAMPKIAALKFKSWLGKPTEKNDESVNGVDSNHVQAPLDGAAFVRSITAVSQSASGQIGAQIKQLESQAQNALKDTKVDLWVGKSDHLVHRLVMSLNISVPAAQQAQFSGLTGGSVKLSVDFSDAGKRQTIAPPPNPRPYTDLRNQFGGASGAAGSSGGTNGAGSSGAGGSSAPSAAKTQRWAKCIQRAAGKPAAAAQCNKLLK